MLMRRRSAFVLALAALPAFPSSASASSADVSATLLSVGGSAQVNSINISPVAGKLRVADTALAATMTPQTDCVAVDAKTVDCLMGQTATGVVGLQAGDDQFYAPSVTSTAFFVNGGGGDDEMWSGDGDDVLSGAAGDDNIEAGGGNDVFVDSFQFLFGFESGAGNDTLKGQAGDDRFDAGANHITDGNGVGADTFDGGPGVDTVDYSKRTVPLKVTVHATGGDGAAGENDHIVNVERTLGGSAADDLAAGPVASTLVGAAGDDTLRGGTGADQLFGGTEADATGSGDDTLDGGAGADVLRGGDGRDTATYAKRGAPVIATLDDVANDGEPGEQDNIRGDVEHLVGGSAGDTLTGSSAANTIDGGLGPDTIDGGDAADTLAGGEGDDVIRARDGQADTVSCGTGTDQVQADLVDVVAADCEQVDRPATAAPVIVVVQPGPGGDTPGGETSGAVSVTLRGGTLRPDRRGRIAVTLACPAGAQSACAGVLALRTAKPARTILTRSYRVAPGRRATLRLALPRSLRARIRRARRVKLQLVATATGARVGAAITVAKRR